MKSWIHFNIRTQENPLRWEFWLCRFLVECDFALTIYPVSCRVSHLFGKSFLFGQQRCWCRGRAAPSGSHAHSYFSKWGEPLFISLNIGLSFGWVKAASKVEQVTEKPLVCLVCKGTGWILMISEFSSISASLYYRYSAFGGQRKKMAISILFEDFNIDDRFILTRSLKGRKKQID